ncbi:hypothetical protein CSB08_00570 [Candidatus Gracilibacteria bacterium]|nr:MAG: hypothetical protein CSB08_00570 [Candidatus Gracilibacteria bacterium]
MLKKILLLVSLFSFFFLIIFYGILFTKKFNNQEENRKILLLKNKSNIEIENKIKKEIKNIDLSSAKKVEFFYWPENFGKKTKKLKNILTDIINSKKFKDKVSNIKIELHKEKDDVRGNMKNKKIKLFGVMNIPKGEIISVFIHELGHYIDLYYFINYQKINDTSNNFYNISWKNYKTIKKGEEIKDFVSGYAMSNKYEDFAESFTYYILHNKDFLYKTKNSKSLERKYNFFNLYLFKNNSFKGEDYSKGEIKPYYWDITKIDISLENFLQYIKK